jgi:MYXO-CTERM domain-containing protein
MRSAAFALALLGFPSVALAHFHLDEPAANLVQATNGDPQKTGPCGGLGTATGMVTNYEPGGVLTLKLAETISHPGHYRVAIAQNEASLPAPPTVTGANCAMAAIEMTPTLPLLADGLFPNITPADGVQTAQIQLPAGYTCTNCVVQVIEFMSNHAEPCFYYHCANVNIVANAPDAGMVTMPDAGMDPGGGGGGGGGGGEVSGGCSTGNATGLVALVGLLGLRRRRRN